MLSGASRHLIYIQTLNRTYLQHAETEQVQNAWVTSIQQAADDLGMKIPISRMDSASLGGAAAAGADADGDGRGSFGGGQETDSDDDGADSGAGAGASLPSKASRTSPSVSPPLDGPANGFGGGGVDNAIEHNQPALLAVVSASDKSKSWKKTWGTVRNALCCAVLCCAVLCCAVLCFAVCCAVLCCAVVTLHATHPASC